MDKWRVGGCRDVEPWLLSLSRISGSLLGQGAGMDCKIVGFWLCAPLWQFKCSCQAKAEPGGYHSGYIGTRHSVTCTPDCGKKWPAASARFSLTERVPLGYFQNHCLPPVTYTLHLPQLSAFILHVKYNMHIRVSHAAWRYWSTVCKLRNFGQFYYKALRKGKTERKSCLEGAM